MVLGLTRPRLRSDGPGLFALRNHPVAPMQVREWTSERGQILFEASAEIIGGFPGYADRGCLLDSAHLRITDRYLIASDGQPQGFAVPLDSIEGSALVAQPGRDDHALNIFYRAGETTRLFTIRFRTTRIGGRVPRRSLRAQQALHTAGIVDRYAADPPQQPNFTVPWEQTREFDNENVIWTGRAHAPLYVGGDLVPSDVWLTTKSLIWGSGSGNGINRIPLPLIMDLVATRLRDRFGTPVVYLAIGDASTGRYELPFTFNIQSPPDRNFRERGAFVVGLRSRGIVDGTTAPCCQPWRTTPPASRPEPIADAFSGDGASDEPGETSATVDLEAVMPCSADLLDDEESAPQLGGEPVRRRGGLAARVLRATAFSTREPGHEPDDSKASADEEGMWAVDREAPDVESDPAADALDSESAPDDGAEHVTTAQTAVANDADDVVVAEWSAADQEAAPVDRPIAETWAERGDAPENSVVSPSLEIESFVSAVDPDPLVMVTSEPWAAVRHYEEHAIGAISEALRVIDDCIAGRCGAPLAEHAPSSWDQARALAELKDLADRGDVQEEDARRRKERLLALGETCVRLRTLIELHDHGYLSIEELDRKRSALIDALSTALVRFPAPKRPIADVA